MIQIDSEFWVQVWSGTGGALLGAALGTATALLILSRTNRHQTRIAREASQEQRDQSDAALKLQAADAAVQLAAQRDARRENREIEALADLVGVVRRVAARIPELDGLDSDIVTASDVFVLNLPAAVKWRQGEAWSASSTNPIANLVVTELAIAHVSFVANRRVHQAVTQKLGAYAGSTGISAADPSAVQGRLLKVCDELLTWPHLGETQQSELILQWNERATAQAAEIVGAVLAVVRLENPQEVPRQIRNQDWIDFLQAEEGEDVLEQWMHLVVLGRPESEAQAEELMLIARMNAARREDVVAEMQAPIEHSRESLDRALQRVRSCFEPVTAPRGTLQFQRHFCAIQAGNAEQLRANEPKRTELYESVRILLLTYGALASDLSRVGYSPDEAIIVKADIANYTSARDEVGIGAGEFPLSRHPAEA